MASVRRDWRLPLGKKQCTAAVGVKSEKDVREAALPAAGGGCDPMARPHAGAAPGELQPAGRAQAGEPVGDCPRGRDPGLEQRWGRRSGRDEVL